MLPFGYIVILVLLYQFHYISGPIGTPNTISVPPSNNTNTVIKKARVIETPKLPAIKRSTLGPVRAQMGLFWIEQNNPTLKTKVA